MAKILILPLLTMTSGHHKVADVVSKELKAMNHEVITVDILSDSWGSLEKSITNIYKKVLGIFPQSYEALYRFIAGPENYNKLNFTKGLGCLFSYNMKAIIKRERPDFIICTHGFPSSIINKLKEKNKCKIPVLNIYTDFFINNFWGCSKVEYHFVSSLKMKKLILKRNNNALVYITGIPVSRVFNKTSATKEKPNSVLITGGSGGYGSILKILSNLNCKGSLNYKIMCGSNNKLFSNIEALHIKNIKPLPYVNSATEICKLYDEASIIIGKPGGITITECLKRKKMFYIHSCLPGQEYYNYHYLKGLALIYDGLNKKITEKQLLNIIINNPKKTEITNNVNTYLQQLKPSIFETLNNIVNSKYLTKTIGG
ncbi:hypothetical protein IMX26_02080 [Clostridium sp. 'deep sea']|uniref:MGDG synthase family glycosyltransferase n=1 Tax=Clostridium sp. 'deep sea' TaxID=2779445 RepID=UPI00189645B6|nr:hypothetical protein [Clostridium sp. 'deep sea']QOR35639.1 hypothetical protein IMX26_02080 [Clostridium sp. 'deep sea']